jgi:hexulose-6-phosphate isomerase
MKLGAIHKLVGTADLSAAFRLASQTQAKGLEIFYADGDEAKNLGREDYAAKLKGLIEQYSLPVPSLCLANLCAEQSLIGPPQTVERNSQIVAHAMETAAAIGAKVIVLPFFGKNTIEADDELDRAVQALMGLVEQAEAAGVVLGIESSLNIAQQQFLLGCLGNSDNARIYFDTGNVLSRKIDPSTAIRDLGPGSICQVHFKDVKMIGGQAPQFNVALGTGDVDFPAVCQALRAIGYDGWIILETPAGDAPMGNLVANLAMAAKIIGAE